MTTSCSAAALFANVVALPVNVGPFDNTTFPVPVAEAATANDGVLVEFVTVGASQEGQLPEGAAKDDTAPPPLPHADPVLEISPALLICRQAFPLDASAPVSVRLGTVSGA
jgi:hypothetical protein